MKFVTNLKITIVEYIIILNSFYVRLLELIHSFIHSFIHISTLLVSEFLSQELVLIFLSPLLQELAQIGSSK